MCVVHRYVKIKIPDRKVDQWIWMTSCIGSARGDIWGFWEVSWVENLTPNEKGRLSGLAEARRICALRAPHEMVVVVGVRWKKQNRKNVYPSPYVEEPLNSKVIKSFVPELRRRKCFSCFEIPMFYVYMLWTFYVRFTYPDIWLWYKMKHQILVQKFVKQIWHVISSPEITSQNAFFSDSLSVITALENDNN